MTLLHSLMLVDTNINTDAVIGPHVNIPIQAVDSETPIVQPTDAKFNRKLSTVRRPTPPPKPRKKNSVKASDQTAKLQHALTCPHDEGRITIQVLQNL